MFGRSCLLFLPIRRTRRSKSYTLTKKKKAIGHFLIISPYRCKNTPKAAHTAVHDQPKNKKCQRHTLIADYLTNLETRRNHQLTRIFLSFCIKKRSFRGYKRAFLLNFSEVKGKNLIFLCPTLRN